MMISHQLAIFCYINENGEMFPTTTLQEFTTSDGIFNISLMKMNTNLMMMSGPIL